MHLPPPEMLPPRLWFKSTKTLRSHEIQEALQSDRAGLDQVLGRDSWLPGWRGTSTSPPATLQGNVWCRCCQCHRVSGQRQNPNKQNNRPADKVIHKPQRLGLPPAAACPGSGADRETCPCHSSLARGSGSDSRVAPRGKAAPKLLCCSL